MHQFRFRSPKRMQTITEGGPSNDFVAYTAIAGLGILLILGAVFTLSEEIVKVEDSADLVTLESWKMLPTSVYTPVQSRGVLLRE